MTKLTLTPDQQAVLIGQKESIEVYSASGDYLGDLYPEGARLPYFVFGVPSMLSDDERARRLAEPAFPLSEVWKRIKGTT
jgi:hypothetical protein